MPQFQFPGVSNLVDMVMPKPQPKIVPMPPQMFRPRPPAPPPMPGLSPNLPIPPPAGFQELPGGFDPEQQVPGRMTYGGPHLNTEAALAGLKAAPQSPLIELAATSFQPAGGAFRGGQDIKAALPFQQFARESLAPQRGEIEAVQTSLMGQHPAMRALAATSAYQKSLPAQATAHGMIESAEIGADASQRKAMIDAMQGQKQEAAESMTPIWNFLESLPLDEDISNYPPHMQELIVRAMQALGQYSQRAGF